MARFSGGAGERASKPENRVRLTLYLPKVSLMNGRTAWAQSA